jgi:hypothetical protein
VCRRLRELPPHRIDQFWHYIEEVDREKVNITTCTNEELLIELTNAHSDSNRYARDSYVTPELEYLTETNFAIMAFASDRAIAAEAEILKRMRKPI